MRGILPFSALLLLAACQLQPSLGPRPLPGDGAPNAATPRPATTSKPSPRPPDGGATAPVRRLAALAAALQDARTTRELARANDLISDRGGGLVSKIRTGVVSNNGATIIGQNGANVGSAGGADLVGNHGAGYALAQEAPPSDPPIAGEQLAEDPPFQYVTTYFKPFYAGRIVGYDLVDYKARGRAATVLERYVWGDVPIEPLERIPGVPYDVVRGTFNVRVERSRRLAFTTRIDLVFEMLVKRTVPTPLTEMRSMTAAFVMAVPDGQGGTDELVMRAHDYVYPPGAGPGETPDGVYPFPSGFEADGRNARGKLTMKASSPLKGEVTANLSSTYTRAAGGVVRTEVVTYADGRLDERVIDDATGLQVALRFGADGAGSGEVRDPVANADVGRLRWAADGQGTILLDGEPEAPLSLR